MAKRLNDLERKEITAYYIECQNARETARKFNVSPNTVRKIVNGDNDIEQECTQKTKENTKTVLDAMEDRRDTKIKLLDKILKAMDKKATNVDMFTNIKDLATAYGIIMDKELKILELNSNKNNENEINNAKEILIKIKEIANEK
jgi:hypothetical protein